MRLATVRDAAVEAVLAGALVGLYEGATVASSAGRPVVAPFVAALAAVTTIACALVLRVAFAWFGRTPLVARWRDDLVTGGERRTRAAWRALVVVLVALAIAVPAFVAFELVHERYRFNDAGPLALAFAGGVVLVAYAAGLAGMHVERAVAPRLPPALLDGVRAWVALVSAGVALVVAAALLAGRAIPALDRDVAIAPALLLCAVVAVMLLHAGRRVGAWIAAGVVAIAMVAGVWSIRGAPEARGVVLERGVASTPVLRALLRAGDGDGDGYAAERSGGADCDDGDARRSPGASDVPDNGIDENCTGIDAVRTTFGLRNEARPVPPVQVRPNIVVISVDALRADHLGSYGYARETSPALDALAAGGIRFERAYTSCPSTRCSIPALHTGRFASTVRGIDRATVPSLAGVLRDAGWSTAAITCCERFADARGVLAGFTTINAGADAIRMQRAGQSNADVVVDYALAWLTSIDRSRPYFAWLHLYEPHFPYAAPGGTDFGDSDVDRYDQEIAYVDAQIGRLVAALDPSTVVVVTADHGEEFGEHGQRYHARSLYDGVVRVPLIVRLPGAAPRVVATPVSIVDIMPTLLDLAGVTGPTGMNGRTLVPALRGGAAPARPVLIELAHDHQIKRDMAAIVHPPWKVIWDRQVNAWSLYALDDEAEATDRARDPTLPELQRLLRETLDRETGALTVR